MKAVYGRVIVDQERCIKCKCMFFPIKREQYCSFCIDEVPAWKAKGQRDTSDKIVIKYNRVDTIRRKSATPCQRKRVAKRDEYICQYCGKDVKIGFVIDHVIPWRVGGENTLENLVCACRRCNLMKSGTVFNDFEDAKRFLTLRNKGYSRKRALGVLSDSVSGYIRRR